jgi:hypothetical protein
MRIQELRDFLNKEESKWTGEDRKYLGEFGDQEIYVPVYKWNPTKGAADFKGYGRDLNVHWDITGLGLFIEDKE